MTAWSRWIAFCGRQESVLPLALVRVLVATVLLGDLFRVAQLGLVDVLWKPAEYGGLGARYAKSAILDTAPSWAGPATYGVTVAALFLVLLGIATRPAMIVGVLAYAQLGHLYSAGDRGIDRLLRTVLVILAVSGSHRGLTVLHRHSRAQVSHGTTFLLRLLLVVVYTCSGVGKVASTGGWLGWERYPPLYRIVSDPMAGTLDPVMAHRFHALFQMGSWATVALELSAWLLFTRWAPWWGLVGVAMHLGIFNLMDLGMFSWGMLALYPLVFERWILERLGPPPV